MQFSARRSLPVVRTQMRTLRDHGVSQRILTVVSIGQQISNEMSMQPSYSLW